MRLSAPELIAHIRGRLGEAADAADLSPYDPFRAVLDAQEWSAIETIRFVDGLGPANEALAKRFFDRVRGAAQEDLIRAAAERERHSEASKKLIIKWTGASVAVQIATALCFAGVVHVSDHPAPSDHLKLVFDHCRKSGAAATTRQYTCAAQFLFDEQTKEEMR